MNAINTDELEKSISYLLEALADILDVGGPPFNPARDELRDLLRSAKALDSETLKRLAYNLANLTEEIAERVRHGAVEIKGDEDQPPAPQPAPVQARKGDKGLSGESSSLLLEIVENVVLFRPKHYQQQVEDLEALIKAGAPMEDILRQLGDLVFQIRTDFWDERSKAYKHIEKILKSLEATERDFISSLCLNQGFVRDSNQAFTSTMEEGLKDIGSLVTPGKYDLEELCRQLSDKVSILQQCVLEKKRPTRDTWKIWPPNRKTPGKDSSATSAIMMSSTDRATRCFRK